MNRGLPWRRRWIERHVDVAGPLRRLHSWTSRDLAIRLPDSAGVVQVHSNQHCRDMTETGSTGRGLLGWTEPPLFFIAAGQARGVCWKQLAESGSRARCGVDPEAPTIAIKEVRTVDESSQS